MNQNTVHFFVAITALSLFILCLFFLEGDKKRERENNVDNKMHGVPFHQKINGIKRYDSLDIVYLLGKGVLFFTIHQYLSIYILTLIIPNSKSVEIFIIRIKKCVKIYSKHFTYTVRNSKLSKTRY